jgi:hypothetical protein
MAFGPTATATEIKAKSGGGIASGESTSYYAAARRSSLCFSKAPKAKQCSIAFV